MVYASVYLAARTDIEIKPTFAFGDAVSLSVSPCLTGHSGREKGLGLEAEPLLP